MSEKALIERLDEVLFHLRGELLKACKKHAPMHSPHEGYSVIIEEVNELWDHVKADTGRSDEAQKEALQIAAMGIRYVLDVVPFRVPCAACDRGDHQLGHADDCVKRTSEGDQYTDLTVGQLGRNESIMSEKLFEAINKAARDLPDKCEIHIVIENGAAWVDGFDKTGGYVDFDQTHDLTDDIEEALRTIISEHTP